MKYGVFISYSREDEQLVSPLVKLISSMRHDLVFQDVKDIQPAQKWEPQLLKALHQADLLIVFWCQHSSNSKYVKQEYETAIDRNKNILPILLDKTKLNKKLAPYQWIDLRQIINHKTRKWGFPAIGFQPKHYAGGIWLILALCITLIPATQNHLEKGHLGIALVKCLKLLLYTILVISYSTTLKEDFLPLDNYRRHIQYHTVKRMDIAAYEIVDVLNTILPKR